MWPKGKGEKWCFLVQFGNHDQANFWTTATNPSGEISRADKALACLNPRAQSHFHQEANVEIHFGVTSASFSTDFDDTDVCLFCHTQLWGRYWLHRRVLFIPHTRLWEWFFFFFFCLAKPWQHKHVMCMPNTGVRLLCQTQLSEIFWLEILRVIFDFGCMWLLCQPSLWVLFCFCFLPTISLRMTDLYKYAIMTNTVTNFKNRCAWLLCHTWLLVQI